LRTVLRDMGDIPMNDDEVLPHWFYNTHGSDLFRQFLRSKSWFMKLICTETNRFVMRILLTCCLCGTQKRSNGIYLAAFQGRDTLFSE
jgi:hypothetical protein